MNGILFTPPMIEATQREVNPKMHTRRLSGLEVVNRSIDHANQKCSPSEYTFIGFDGKFADFARKVLYKDGFNIAVMYHCTPRYHAGETVYIKETWAADKKYDALPPRDIPEGSAIWYKTSPLPPKWVGKWRSPMFMPAWTARYFLKILTVEPKRLQDMTEADAIAEGTPINDFLPIKTAMIAGITAVDYFAQLWDSINPLMPWDFNPWVWDYGFERTEVGK